MLSKLNYIKTVLINQYYRMRYYPRINKSLKKFNVKTVFDTIHSLIYSNNSLSRFGDGEIKWIFLQSNIPFEKNSVSLSNRLIQVLTSNDDRLEIGLPNIFCNINQYNYRTRRFYELFMVKIGYKILPYLKINKTYYNTGISRIYSEIRNKKKYFPILFNQLKQVWRNKHILIIEGQGTRLGVGNNLFNNTLSINRIECPIVNAFESYSKILNISERYLLKHNYTLTLIALGPTATILSYDLTKLGFRSIDIGHIDMEYEWYLMGAKNKINIPSRYVNETSDKNGINITPIHDRKYFNEIIYKIN